MTEPKKHVLAVEIGFLLLLALLWGSSYLFIKVAVAEIPPFTLTAIRVTIAAIMLLGVLAWRKERLPRDRKTWRMLLVQAFFNSIGAWSILAWGQQYVDSGLASVLNSTAPIFVFLITAVFTRHEAINGLKMAGAMLGLVGVTLIVGVDVLNGLGTQVAGQLAALGGGFLYACAAIYGRRLGHLSAASISTGTMLWAVIFMVPMALVVDHPWELRPSMNAMLAAAALAVFCTGIALLIYFRLLKTLGSLGVTSQAYLRAGVGVALGVTFLGEQITWVVAVGLVVAVLGVIAINFPTRQTAK